MGEIDQKMKKQRRNKVTRRTVESEPLERFNTLPWNPSLPTGEGDDPFSLFSGTNELDGGCLSLKEIDESDYVLDIPGSVREDKKEKAAVNNKSKKRKTVENDDISSSKTESKDDIDEEKKKVKPKKKRNKRKKKTKKGEKISEETEDRATGLLSLEEINESDYVLDIPESVREDKKEKAAVNNKSKKRKTVENDGIFSNETESKDDIDEEKKKVKPKKKRNKRKKKTKKGEKTSEETEDRATGLLSLEEINESDYVLDIPESVREDKKEKAAVNNKSKKRKTVENDGIFSNETESKDDIDEEKKKVKPKKKRNKRKKKTKKGEKTSEETEDPATDIIVPEDDIEGESIDEAEYYAWNELRLHSLLMKSIYRLKFKEPTPIQKACIPAAAHQGKDVIGAAETGSGKTLAFGLPMLQRLLEEKEKADNIVEENGEAAERIAPKGVLRGLIITPTRELALQVNAHLKAVALGTNIKVVPIVGGMSSEKQERLLKSRPEIVVGTPGRLWELMSSGQIHLVELHSLSFFVLDEADRMIETGHFQELQSIIDMLPMTQDSHEGNSQKDSESCVTVSSFQRKKRQTLVFSATLSLSDDFRKKLKRGALKSKQISKDGLNLETLSERAGMKANAAIIDLTNALIMADKLEESFIECGEVNKDAHLYYILTVHGQGRTIVFCTSIAALRHISSLLRIVGINVYTLHGEMEQNARLKSMDRFRENDHGILVATDVAARGLDIPGVRTVIHYQLPHSAEVYVHRSGRTARASTEGCSIILLSPKDRSKFASLCKSFSKESFRRFPVEISYMPEVSKRLSLARQIDKISRKESQNKAKETWLAKNAEAIEVDMETDESEDERVESHKQKKSLFMQLQKLQHELNMLLSRPLQPKTFSRRYLAGAGISPFLQHQFEELATQKLGQVGNPGQGKRGKFLVIGQDCVEPLQALKNANREVMNLKEASGKWKNVEDLRRKKKEQKKRLHDQRRKLKKQMKNGME